MLFTYLIQFFIGVVIIGLIAFGSILLDKKNRQKPKQKPVVKEYREPNRDENIVAKVIADFSVGDKVIPVCYTRLVNSHEYVAEVKSLLWDWPGWDYKIQFDSDKGQNNLMSYYWEHELQKYTPKVK